MNINWTLAIAILAMCASGCLNRTTAEGIVVPDDVTWGLPPSETWKLDHSNVRFDGVYCTSFPTSRNGSVTTAQFFPNGRCLMQPIIGDSHPVPTAETAQRELGKGRSGYSGVWFVEGGNVISKWYAPTPDGYRYHWEMGKFSFDGASMVKTEGLDKEWKKSSGNSDHKFVPVLEVKKYTPRW
jgi:hypothetical protein